MHTTEIVEFKKLSSGQMSALIRCCGNASTDHWHTMAVEVAGDPTSRKASLGEARETIAIQHEAAIQAESGLLDEVGVSQEHS